MPIPTALTIAGSDSGGGAGIQADLKTFEAHEVFGTSAITAITAQNTRGVSAVLAMPPDLVVAQIEAVLQDIGAGAIKIGMLANGEIVTAVANTLMKLAPATPIVLDTVMVAKGGARLLDDEAVDGLRTRLVPIAVVITPNVPEAEALLGRRIDSRAAMRQAARDLVASGARAALVKGGHLPGPAVDVLFDGDTVTEFEAPRIETRHTHGTGCTYSAAIAAQLARGTDLIAAIRAAKTYVTDAIRQAPSLGSGHGPLGHRAARVSYT